MVWFFSLCVNVEEEEKSQWTDTYWHNYETEKKEKPRNEESFLFLLQVGLGHAEWNEMWNMDCAWE